MDRNGVTPLHWAANGGHTETAALLLSNRADTNAKDNNGVTPLHAAAGKGRKEMVALLLANKADVNARDVNGVTPLLAAASNGQKETAQVLCAASRANAGLSISSARRPSTPRFGGYKDVAELLHQPPRRHQRDGQRRRDAFAHGRRERPEGRRCAAFGKGGRHQRQRRSEIRPDAPAHRREERPEGSLRSAPFEQGRDSRHG